MKKFLIPLVSLLIGFVVIFSWWNLSIKPVSKTSEEQDFLVLKGSSATQIANKLEKEGFIRSSLAFKFYVQLTGKAKKIPSGEFQLSSDKSMFEIISTLIKGPKAVWVTVPEGLRREEIANIFITTLDKKSDDATLFKSDFLSLTEGKEGYLFPDTYLVPKTITAQKTVSLIDSTFQKRIESIQNEIDSSSLNLDQIIILASMLERETITEAEKPVVAGILLKRFQNDWPLQVDATVQYAEATSRCKTNLSCDWWKESLSSSDLEINSSYNTYKYAGLPPAPISNPGITSIKASASPEDSPYWFYIHDEEGNIHYAKTLEEHNANVRKYLGK